MGKVLIIFLLVGLFAMVAVAADFEEKISIQGRLTGTDGSPRANETVTLMFNLYNDQGKTTQVHTETQTGIQTDSNGIFNTAIGETAFLSDPPGTTGYIIFEEQYWLEIKEGDTVIGFSPLRATPYAITAKNVKGRSVNVTNQTGIGVYGESGVSLVPAITDQIAGVSGKGNAYGVFGEGGAAGVFGESSDDPVSGGNGVAGTGKIGVYGYSAEHIGVYGQSTNGVGVFASSIAAGGEIADAEDRSFKVDRWEEDLLGTQSSVDLDSHTGDTRNLIGFIISVQDISSLKWRSATELVDGAWAEYDPSLKKVTLHAFTNPSDRTFRVMMIYY